MQAAHPALPCFELDHPATQEVKLKVREVTPPDAAPVLIPADLTGVSPAELLRAETRFRVERPTLFIAEGLLMYLPPARVESLFQELAAFAAPGSRFALTWMVANPDRPLTFHQSSRAIGWWLRWRREPFQWELPRDQVDSFAEAHGWHLAAMSSPEEIRRRFLSPHGLENESLAEGESVALLVKGDQKDQPINESPALPA